MKETGIPVLNVKFETQPAMISLSIYFIRNKPLWQILKIHNGIFKKWAFVSRIPK